MNFIKNRNMKKKKIIMTVGMPFSGKSIAAKEYKEKGWVVIERDKILDEILAQETFMQEVINEARKLPEVTREDVFKIQNKIAIEKLTDEVINKIKEGEEENYFYDGTNLQKEARRGIATLDKESFDVEVMLFAVPLEELKKRAQKVAESNERGGSFNEGALKNIERMYNMFEAPELDEGYSKITEIHLPDEVKNEMSHFSLR